MRGEGRAQLTDGDASADVQMAGAAFNLLQVGDGVEEGDLAKITQLFGDPETDIGGPGDQGGVGVLKIPIGEIIGVRRAESGGCLPPPGLRPPPPRIFGQRG